MRGVVRRWRKLVRAEKQRKKMQLKLVVANSGPEGYVPRSTLARVLDKVYQTSLNVWIFGIAG